MYSRGWAVPQSYFQARTWYQKAADQGFPPGEVALAGAFFNGWGGPQSLTQAVYWDRKAADQGYAVGQVNLGRYCAAGMGVERDQVQAYIWISLAQAMGYPIGSDLARLESKMSAEQIETAKGIVSDWLAKHPNPQQY
jgi:TPR repeat protein